MTTTTAAAKIPAGLTAFTTDVTFKPLISVSTWTATNSSFASQLTTWVDKVEVTLVGQPDAAKEPAKTMNTWATTNATAISGQSLAAELKVSSWAIVVDVTTKAGSLASTALSQYNQAIYRSTDTCYNTTVKNTETANAPALGVAGDTWAIQISTGSTYIPPAIRSGAYVSVKQTTLLDQSSALEEKSWAVTASPVLASWETIKADQAFTWAASESKCDEAKWASATACKGLGGVWGANTNTWAASTAKGTHRYFHWLADSVTDKTKNLAIEDKDVVNVVVIESRAFVYEAGTDTVDRVKNCLVASGKTRFGLATKQYVKGSGATSTILGASALIAGVLASLF